MMIIKGAEALFVVDNDPKHFLYVANIKRRGLPMFTYVCKHLFEQGNSPSKYVIFCLVCEDIPSE